jgi:hypothetical protein
VSLVHGTRDLVLVALLLSAFAPFMGRHDCKIAGIVWGMQFFFPLC